MRLNIVLTPQVAYTQVKVQVCDLVRVMGIVAPFARGGSVFGENSFYPAPGCKGDLSPAAVHHGRARQISGTGPCGYRRRVLWVLGPWGQYSGNPGYKTRESPCG